VVFGLVPCQVGSFHQLHPEQYSMSRFPDSSSYFPPCRSISGRQCVWPDPLTFSQNRSQLPRLKSIQKGSFRFFQLHFGPNLNLPPRSSFFEKRNWKYDLTKHLSAGRNFKLHFFKFRWFLFPVVGASPVNFRMFSILRFWEAFSFVSSVKHFHTYFRLVAFGLFAFDGRIRSSSFL